MLFEEDQRYEYSSEYEYLLESKYVSIHTAYYTSMCESLLFVKGNVYKYTAIYPICAHDIGSVCVCVCGQRQANDCLHQYLVFI